MTQLLALRHINHSPNSNTIRAVVSPKAEDGHQAWAGARVASAELEARIEVPKALRSDVEAPKALSGVESG